MSEQEKNTMGAAFGRLVDFESETPEHLFDDLMSRRTDADLRDRLNNFESIVPNNLFNNLLNQRIESDLGKRLNNFESKVPNSLFDDLLNRRIETDLGNRLNDFESETPKYLFDKLQERRDLRDRLTDFESPVKPYVIDKVLDERDEHRRRRFFYWRWAAAAAVFLLLAAALWLDSRQSTVDSQQATVNRRQLTGDSQQSAGENNLSENSNNLEQKTQNTEFIAQNPKPKTQNSSDTEGSKNIGIDGMNNSKSDNLESPISNFRFSKAQQISPTTKRERPAAKGGRGGNATAQVVENQLVVDNLSENKNPVLSENLSPSTPLSKNEILGNTLNIDKVKLGIREVYLVNKLPKTWTFLAKNMEKKNPCTGPGDGCPTFGTNNRNSGFGGKTFYIDVFAAPEYAFRTLSLNAVEAEKLLYNRDSMEKSWYAMSTGVRATVIFDNGFSFRIGSVFNQTNEIAKRDSFGENRVITTIDSTRRTDGSWEVITKKEIISGIIHSTRYNRYRSIDIPIQLGYEIPLNNSWTLGINGGANFNIAAWRKADIVNANAELINVSSGIGKSNPIFLNSLGISVLGSFSILRNFENGFQIFAEPSVRYGLKPITRLDYPLKQNYTTVGLNIGLRYRL